MSMSTHVVGFRPPDDKWKRMKAARDACVAAGVEIPEKIHKFFDWIEPDPMGVEIDLRKMLKEWSSEASAGFELNIKDVPEGLCILRFFNSW